MEPNVKHLILPGFPWSTSICILRYIYMCSAFTCCKRYTSSPFILSGPSKTAGPRHGERKRTPTVSRLWF